MSTIKANQLKSKPIITTFDGEKINTVKDVVYDGQKNMITALLVDEGGWFHGAKILPIERIEAIGENAVMIDTADRIVAADLENFDESQLTSTDDQTFLTKKEVFTQDGHNLGRIIDIYFDFPSGEVEAFEVSQGLAKNILTGTKKILIENIITIGKDKVIVTENTQDDVEDQGQSQGLVGATSATLSKTMEVADDLKIQAGEKFQDIKTQAKNLTDQAGTKINEIKDSQQVKNLSQGAAQGVSNLQAQASQSIQNLTESAKEVTGQTKSTIDEARIQNALGKKLGNITLLTLDDEVIAFHGDVITHQIIEQATANDVLEKLLNNLE